MKTNKFDDLKINIFGAHEIIGLEEILTDNCKERIESVICHS
jgi:hypothetical protein